MAASSLREDLTDNGLESLFDPVYDIQESMTGGSEFCFKTSSYHTLMNKICE